MVRMWESGQDTRDIANVMKMRECDVYNRLPAIRQRRRAEMAREPVCETPF
jgi:hypothetical protein